MAQDKKVGTAGLLFSRAQQMGLQPSWVTRNGLFVMNTDEGEQYVNASHFPLNSHVSASLASNKFLTRRILERHHLPNIPYTRPKILQDAISFLHEHGTIIVKPVRGSGARDIRIVSSPEQLDGIDFRAYIFEKYIVGTEMRYLVLNSTVIGVYESAYGTSVAAGRPLQCLSYPRNRWDPALMTLATRITDILGLRFAAVDFLVNAQSGFVILEVNSAPDLKWFHAPTSGPAVDVAGMFLAALLEAIEQRASSSLADTGFGSGLARMYT